MLPAVSLWKRRLAALAVAASCAVSARADTGRADLVHAYLLLHLPHLDYAGHRLLALNELAAAGRELQMPLTGDVPPPEHKLAPDDQLRQARQLVSHSRDQLEPGDRVRVAARLEKAIKEINMALDTH